MAGLSAHLHVHSAFSFLNGASMPEDLVAEAARQGIEVLALTDSDRVSGVVAFLKACEEYGIKGLVGAEVTVEEAGKLILLAPDTEGYTRLNRLLTEAHLSSPRGAPRVSWDVLDTWGPGLVGLTGDREGILARAWLKGRRDTIEDLARRLQRSLAGRVYIELTASLLPGDRLLFRALGDIGQALGIPLVVTAAAHYARKQDFGLFDLMTCIRLGQPVEAVSPERRLNAENYLKPWSMLAQTFRAWPEALATTRQLAETLQTPDILTRRYPPGFSLPDGVTADAYLRHWVRQGAKWRYRERWHTVWPRIRHELEVISRLGYAEYFLVVWDVARYARRQGIRFSGRGSAADSVVAYVLGITDVDAYARQLLFERFMSPERQEAPDIDIDFDARYRDQIEAYVVERYGQDHVARVATYQTYRPRLAVREIGKVLGYPPAELDALAKSLPEMPITAILEHWDDIPELRQYADADRLRQVLAWAQKITGKPRHLGTHLGGVVISQRPLAEIGPRERSAKEVEIMPFDKRDIETLGLMKLDLLSLRIFSAVDIAQKHIQSEQPAFDYDRIPLTDDQTYQRLARGEGVGVFQLESPAQRVLAQRLKPDTWEDIVASLALIRPGPIKGNMVDPFVARRRGYEPVTYLLPELEPILKKTYGVILFQEQVIAIASRIAGFTPGEADALRRVMTHARSPEEMAAIGDRFRAKAEARGIDPVTAQALFQQIAGYASYGFNEAHAAAFAETAYRTAYLLEHYPVAYFVGLLNAEPLGYYPIDILLVEARRRGVTIRPLDINHSQVDVVPEEGTIRLGFRLVKGLGRSEAECLVARRPPGGYRHPEEVIERSCLSMDQLIPLIHVGAFDAINPDRVGLLQDIAGPNALQLSEARPERRPVLAQRLAADYRYLGFGQETQWMALWRTKLVQQGFLTVAEVLQKPPGTPVRLVAMIYRPHRPPTRSGKIVVFLSLWDETGLLEAHLPPEGYQQYGHLLFGGKAVRVVALSGTRQPGGMGIRHLAPWPPETTTENLQNLSREFRQNKQENS